jgi:hypothetical protein
MNNKKLLDFERVEKYNRDKHIVLTRMLSMERLKWWTFGMLCFPIIFTAILYVVNVLSN